MSFLRSKFERTINKWRAYLFYLNNALGHIVFRPNPPCRTNYMIISVTNYQRTPRLRANKNCHDIPGHSANTFRSSSNYQDSLQDDNSGDHSSVRAKARLSYRELVEFQPKYGKSRKELKYTASKQIFNFILRQQNSSSVFFIVYSKRRADQWYKMTDPRQGTLTWMICKKILNTHL